MKSGGGKFKRGRFCNDPLQLVGECWVPIPEFPCYFVSDFGRVKRVGFVVRERVTRSRILSPSLVGNINLTRDGKRFYFKIAQLVLLGFVGPSPYDKPLARHLNDDRSDNRLSNLAWGTHQLNYDDAVRNGRHGAGSPGAVARGAKLKGRQRPQEVAQRISETKRAHPERQFVGGRRGSNGQFV